MSSLTPFQKRITCDIILLCALFVLPWWCSVILGVAFAFFNPRYWELLLVGLLIDSLYAAPFPRYHGFHFVVSLLCAALFMFIDPMRERLRFGGQ